MIVLVNLALGVFNLIPIAPLDGSKILLSLLPRSLYKVAVFYERYSVILLVIFIVFFAGYLSPVLDFLFHILTGLAF